MKGFAVRDLYESFTRQHTDRTAANRAFSDRVLGLMKDKKISITGGDFRELYEALVVSQGLEENVSSSAFPIIAGQIISNTIIQGYEQYPKVGLSLVRVVQSKQKTSLVAGWSPLGKLSRTSEVREKENYPAIEPPEEKSVKIKNRKNGLTIGLTKEAIFFDKTGRLLQDAAGVGAELARWQDEVILCKAIDLDSDAYDGGAMFSAGASIDNLITGADSALGTTGFENALIKFRKRTDEKGKKINVLPSKPVLMFPAELEATADKLLNNEKGPIGSAAQSAVNTARNKFTPVYNPYMTSAANWLLGDFVNSLRWEEVWPLETFQRVGGQTENGFDKDVVAEYKASIYGGCGYDDFRRVIKNAGA